MTELEYSHAYFTAFANREILVKLIHFLSEKGELSIDEFSKILEEESENMDANATTEAQKYTAAYVHKFVEFLQQE